MRRPQIARIGARSDSRANLYERLERHHNVNESQRVELCTSLGMLSLLEKSVQLTLGVRIIKQQSKLLN